MRSPAAGIVGPALVVIMLASGCSSVDRKAAVAEEAMPSASVVPDAAANPSEGPVQAGRRSTRICVINASSVPAAITFTRRDTQSGGPDIAPGQQACAEGRSLSVDVQGSLDVTGESTPFTVFADNSTIGLPTLSVTRGQGCIEYDAWTEGTESSFDDGVVRLTGKRLADTAWKEFTLTIMDSTNPVADGAPRPCTKTPHGGNG